MTSTSTERQRHLGVFAARANRAGATTKPARRRSAADARRPGGAGGGVRAVGASGVGGAAVRAEGRMA
jgi:hypothetical protein